MWNSKKWYTFFFLFLWRSWRVIISAPLWGVPNSKLTGKLFRPRDLLRRKWQTLTKADFQKFASWTTYFLLKNPWRLMMLIGLLEAFDNRRDSWSSTSICNMFFEAWKECDRIPWWPWGLPWNTIKHHGDPRYLWPRTTSFPKTFVKTAWCGGIKKKFFHVRLRQKRFIAFGDFSYVASFFAEAFWTFCIILLGRNWAFCGWLVGFGWTICGVVL